MREIKFQELLPAKVISATTNGTGVDLQGAINPGGREMKAILDIGSKSGTNPTCDVKIQESDALGSGYTDISGAVFTQATAETSEQIHFRTNKRYVRAVATLGGTTPTFGICVLLLTNKRFSEAS